MTTISLPGETISELIGNAALIAQIAQTKSVKAADFDEWSKLTDRFIAFQLEITQRMRAEGVNTIDTGKVQCSLMFDHPTLPGRFLAVLTREGVEL